LAALPSFYGNPRRQEQLLTGGQEPERGLELSILNSFERRKALKFEQPNILSLISSRVRLIAHACISRGNSQSLVRSAAHSNPIAEESNCGVAQQWIAADCLFHDTPARLESIPGPQKIKAAQMNITGSITNSDGFAAKAI